MKVLEKGQFRYTFACEECNAILMAVESDLSARDSSVTSSTGQTGGITQLVCECPECSTIHVADDAKIPTDVRSRVINRKPTYVPRTPFVADLRYK
jgi:hypothetical protein